MTDKKSEIPPIVQASATEKGRPDDPKQAASPDTARVAEPSRDKRRTSALTPVLLVLVLASAGFTLYVWQQQQRALSANADLSAQLQRSVNAANQAAERAQQALTKVQDQAGQIALLETSLRDAMENQQALEQAFQTLTDKGSDLILLNEVDQLVSMAQQQLLLGGNVGNAIISMETAQSKLARANRPNLASLQQTVNGDLDRLRAASTIDVARVSSQLDALNRMLADAPLLLPDDAAPDTESTRDQSAADASKPADTGGAPSLAQDAAWWEKSWHVAGDWTRSAWDSFSYELKQLVSVRRVDDGAALLLSPEQSAQFRENVRLRIMTTRLALMMGQPSVWETETASLLALISARFDPRSEQYRQALKIAQELADTSIAVNLPRVDNSLRAIETLREENANARQEEETETDEPDTQEHDHAPSATDPAVPEAAASGGSGETVRDGRSPSVAPAAVEPTAARVGQGFVLNAENAALYSSIAARFIRQG